MELRKTLLLGALASLLGLLAMAIGLYSLDTYAAYRTPLDGEPPDWRPREKGIDDYRQWIQEKERAERERAKLLESLDTGKMVTLGEEIVAGKGLCFNCHSIGDRGGGSQGPNLEGIGQRAATRKEGLSRLEYLSESLYQPDAYVVEGYAPSMTPANKPPIGLDDLEIKMVVAYLQTLGGEATVTPETKLPHAP